MTEDKAQLEVGNSTYKVVPAMQTSQVHEKNPKYILKSQSLEKHLMARNQLVALCIFITISIVSFDC